MPLNRPNVSTESADMNLTDENYDSSFRNTSRPMHSTYYTKPLPEMQAASQNASLQYVKSSNAYYYQNPQVEESMPEVPTNWDHRYAPEHPQADWSGLVPKEAYIQRRHRNDHISQRENIERNEFGIISKAEPYVLIPHKETSGLNNRSQIVLGGIDEPNERWKTSYQRFDNKESTSRDQLTIDKRVNPIKRISDPAQSRGITPLASPMPSPRDYHSANPTGYSSGVPASSVSTAKYNGRGSLLAGIGDQLVRSNASVANASSSFNKSGVAAPGVYRSEQYRNLINDNYRPFPGYTGMRK